jgi:5'-nucleotidase
MNRNGESPLVLVTNDDGIDSPGIVALARAVERLGGRALVAAPAKNMSGASAAMGPTGPRVSIRRLKVEGLQSECFAVEAPPAMIVISAMSGAFGAIPVAAASGVNAGANLGSAILHSGTVGAALTAQNLGLPSVAVSLESGDAWDIAAGVGAHVLDELLGTPKPRLANVNVPAVVGPDTVIETTRLARFGSVTSAIDGDELSFQMVIDAPSMSDEGSDASAVARGCISVTFLSGITEHATSDVDLQLRKVRV